MGCPGNAQGLYEHTAQGACSDRGRCDPTTGLCSCYPEFFHGPKTACDFKYAPASKGQQPDSPSDSDNQCSGRGDFDPIRGECNCWNQYNGPSCQYMKCPSSNGVLYPSDSGNACNGRGPCDTETGLCGCPKIKTGCGDNCARNECNDQNRCGTPYFGDSCEFERCPNDCLMRGSCAINSGACQCNKEFFGPSCDFTHCPGGCGNGGECNRNHGKCICKDGYSGVNCDKTAQCKAPTALGKPPLNNNQMNWWTIWDQPGWITCPHGQLMYSLKRSLCQALSCIDSGGCAAGCEGEGKHVFHVRHCYHDLRWYSSFDKEG